MIALSFAPVEGNPSASAYRLLEAQVEQHWPQIPRPLTLMRTELGKPCFRDYPECHFNLSHSGKWVACVLSDVPVGVDLQQHRRVPDRVIRKFTPEEQGWLQTHPEDFFPLWVKKEAFLKAIGTGLTRNLGSFSALPLEENTVENYSICLMPAPEGGYSCGVAFLNSTG